MLWEIKLESRTIADVEAFWAEIRLLIVETEVVIPRGTVIEVEVVG